MADWRRVLVAGAISSTGEISVELLDNQAGEGKKPGRIEDVSGADPAAFDKIRRRIPNTSFSTHCTIGGAINLTVSADALQTVLPEQTALLEERFGKWGEKFLLQTVRNTRAPGGPLLRHVFEPTGGGAQIENLELAQLLEMVEMGIYHPTHGWVRFYSAYAEYREALEQEQEVCWKIADRDLPCGSTATVRQLPIGSDSFDGRNCIVCVGPVGDLTVLNVVELHFGHNNGFCLKDLELSGDKILDRKIVGIAPREGNSPLLFEFDRRGGFDPCGLHMGLGGENIQLLSHLAKATLGPRGLGWMSKEELGIE